MNDVLVSKPKLEEGFIDVSVGEPHIVRERLSLYFDLSFIGMYSSPKWMEYPNSAGYQKLIQLLEDKHGSPVIITNGAKQA